MTAKEKVLNYLYNYSQAVEQIAEYKEEQRSGDLIMKHNNKRYIVLIDENRKIEIRQDYIGDNTEWPREIELENLFSKAVSEEIENNKDAIDMSIEYDRMYNQYQNELKHNWNRNLRIL